MMRSAIVISLPRFNYLSANTGFDRWVDAAGRANSLSVSGTGQKDVQLAEKQEHR